MKQGKNMAESISNSEVAENDAQAEMIAGFEAQANQCNQQQEEFADFMDRVNESIDEKHKAVRIYRILRRLSERFYGA